MTRSNAIILGQISKRDLGTIDRDRERTREVAVTWALVPRPSPTKGPRCTCTCVGLGKAHSRPQGWTYVGSRCPRESIN